MSVDRHGALMPKTKRNLSETERRAIRDRLADFQNRHYPDREAMNRDAGVPHSTACGWFNPDPAVPDVVSLVRISERKNLSLNWLLLGEGPELRGIEPSAPIWPQLRQTMVAELIGHGALPEEADRFVPQPDEFFKYLLALMRKGWTARDKPALHTPQWRIGEALGRVIAGLPAKPRRWSRGRLFL